MRNITILRNYAIILFSIFFHQNLLSQTGYEKFCDNDSCIIVDEGVHYYDYTRHHSSKIDLANGIYIEKWGKYSDTVFVKFGIKNNLLDGRCITYNKNGLIKNIGYFSMGIENGLFTEFSNGEKINEKLYSDGTKLEFKTYYKSELLKRREIYYNNINGQNYRLITEWYENLFAIKKLEYKEYAYNNDQIWFERSGQYREWFENGDLKCEGFHKEGHKTGKWTFYSKEKDRITIEHYRKDKMMKKIQYDFYSKDGKFYEIEKIFNRKGEVKKENETVWE